MHLCLSPVVLISLASNLHTLHHGSIEKDDSTSESVYKTDIIFLHRTSGFFLVTVRAMDTLGYVHIKGDKHIKYKQCSALSIL